MVSKNIQTHNLAIVPDDGGLQLQHIYFEPPLQQEQADILSGAGMTLIELDQNGMTKFVARRTEIKSSPEQLRPMISELLSDAGVTIESFAGLAPDPSAQDWKSFVKNRYYEAG